MNKKIIFISLFTTIAITVLYLYSFGPLSGKRATNQFNPASLKPDQSQQATINNKNQSLNIYHNKDMKENFYTIQFPQGWQIQAGKNPGSYNSSYSNGTGTAELMDVPDNSTLELYILSQDEPKLKTSLTGYNRTDYKKVSVNGNEAYQLTYTYQTNSDTFQAIRIYVAGQDHAGLITLAIKQKDFQAVQPIFTSIINSFNWENK